MNVVYLFFGERFVRPQSLVTDFRTKYSGVRKCDLKRGEAVSFAEARTIPYEAIILTQISYLRMNE